MADSRRLRNEAWALNVREQLWELYAVLRQRGTEDRAPRSGVEKAPGSERLTR
jgi:hypothetical protein